MSQLNTRSRKLSLLCICMDTYPPFRVDVRTLFATELANRGHRIDWILQSSDDCPAPFVTRWGGGLALVGATDNGTSRLSRIRKHILGLRNEFQVFRLTSRRRYDVVQVKDLFLTAIPALIAARLSNARFTYWLSYPLAEESLEKARDGTARYPILYLIRGHFFKLVLYRLIMPLADHVFVQSEQMKLDVMEMGIPAHKLTPVPMGMSLAEMTSDSTPEHEAKQNAGATVVYLGTLIRVRRMDFLIRAFTHVLEQVPDAKLLMIGAGDDDSELQELKDLAGDLGLADAIEFTGFIPMSDAWNRAREARVGVSPFFPAPILNSTSPTKLVEYLAMGIPVVANDHPEQKLVITESGGGICVPYEEKPFADAIVELLQHPDRAKQMGELGRAWVLREREYAKISSDVEDEYFRILESSRSPPASP